MTGQLRLNRAIGRCRGLLDQVDCCLLTGEFADGVGQQSAGGPGFGEQLPQACGESLGQVRSWVLHQAGIEYGQPGGVDGLVREHRYRHGRWARGDRSPPSPGSAVEDHCPGSSQHGILVSPWVDSDALQVSPGGRICLVNRQDRVWSAAVQLQAVHECSVLGDDSRPSEQQEWLLEAMRAPTGPTALTSILTGSGEINSKIAPMLPVYAAVDAEPAGKTFARATTIHRAGMTRLVDALADNTH